MSTETPIKPTTKPDKVERWDLDCGGSASWDRRTHHVRYRSKHGAGVTSAPTLGAAMDAVEELLR